MNQINTIEDYINQYPDEIRKKLHAIKKTILEVEPNLVEKMSYQLPTFWLQKNIIHFGVSKHHIGIYPGNEAIAHFQKELSMYVVSKGTVQVKHDQEVPHALIQDMVKFNLNNIKK